MAHSEKAQKEHAPSSERESNTASSQALDTLTEQLEHAGEESLLVSPEELACTKKPPLKVKSAGAKTSIPVSTQAHEKPQQAKTASKQEEVSLVESMQHTPQQATIVVQSVTAEGTPIPASSLPKAGESDVSVEQKKQNTKKTSQNIAAKKTTVKKNAEKEPAKETLYTVASEASEAIEKNTPDIDDENYLKSVFSVKKFLPELAAFDQSELDFLTSKYLHGPRGDCSRLLSVHRLERQGACIVPELTDEQFFDLIERYEGQTGLTYDCICTLHTAFSQGIWSEETIARVSAEAHKVFPDKEIGADDFFALLQGKISCTQAWQVEGYQQLLQEISSLYITYEDGIAALLEKYDIDFSSQAYQEVCFYYCIFSQICFAHGQRDRALYYYGIFNMLSELFHQVHAFKVLRHGFTTRNDFLELKYCEGRSSFTKHSCYTSAADIDDVVVDPWHFCYLRRELSLLQDDKDFKPLLICDALVQLIESEQQQVVPIKHLPYEFDFCTSLHAYFITNQVKKTCLSYLQQYFQLLLDPADGGKKRLACFEEIFFNESKDPNFPLINESIVLNDHLRECIKKLEQQGKSLSSELLDYAGYFICKRVIFGQVMPILKSYHYLDLVRAGSSDLTKGVKSKFVDIITDTILFRCQLFCSQSLQKLNESSRELLSDEQKEEFYSSCLDAAIGQIEDWNFDPLYFEDADMKNICQQYMLLQEERATQQEESLIVDHPYDHMALLSFMPPHAAFLLGRAVTFGDFVPRNAVQGYAALSYADLCGHALATTYMATLYHTMFDRSLTLEGAAYVRLHLRALKAYAFSQVGHVENKDATPLLDFGNVALFPHIHLLRNGENRRLYYKILCKKFPHFKEVLHQINPNVSTEPEADMLLREQKRSLIYTIISNTLLYMIELFEQRPVLLSTYKPAFCALLRWLRSLMRENFMPEGCLVMARLVVSQMSFEQTYLVDNADEFGLLDSDISELLFYQIMPQELWKYSKKDQFLNKYTNSRLSMASMFLQIAMTDSALVEQACAIFDRFFSSLEGNFTPLIVPCLDKMTHLSAGFHNGQSLSYLSEIKHSAGQEKEAEIYSLLGQQFCTAASYKRALEYAIKYKKPHMRLALAQEMVFLQFPYGYYETYLCLKDNEQRKEEAHTYLFYAARMSVPEAMQEYTLLSRSGRFTPLPFLTWFLALESMAATNVQAMCVLLYLSIDGAIVPPNSTQLLKLVDIHQATFSDPQIKRIVFDRGIIDPLRMHSLGVGGTGLLFCNFESEHSTLRHISETANGNAESMKLLKELQHMAVNGLRKIEVLRDPKVEEVLRKINSYLEKPKTTLEYVVGCNWRQSISFPTIFTPCSNEEALEYLSKQSEFKKISIETACADVLSTLDHYDKYVAQWIGCYHPAASVSPRDNAAVSMLLNHERLFEGTFSVCPFTKSLLSLKALALMSLRAPSYRPQINIFRSVLRYLANARDPMALRLNCLDFSFLNEEPYGIYFQSAIQCKKRVCFEKEVCKQRKLSIGGTSPVSDKPLNQAILAYASAKFHAGVPFSAGDFENQTKKSHSIHQIKRQVNPQTKGVLYELLQQQGKSTFIIDEQKKEEITSGEEAVPEEQFTLFMEQLLSWTHSSDRGTYTYLNNALYMLSQGTSFFVALLASHNVWVLGRHSFTPQRSWTSHLAKMFLTESEPGAKERFLYYVQSHYFCYNFGQCFIKGRESDPLSEMTLDLVDKGVLASDKAKGESVRYRENAKANGVHQTRWRFCGREEEFSWQYAYTPLFLPHNGYDAEYAPVLTPEEQKSARDSLKDYVALLDGICKGQTCTPSEARTLAALLTSDDIRHLRQTLTSLQTYKPWQKYSFSIEGEDVNFATYKTLYGYTNCLQPYSLKANLGPQFLSFAPEKIESINDERYCRWSYQPQQQSSQAVCLDEESFQALEHILSTGSIYDSAYLEVSTLRLALLQFQEQRRAQIPEASLKLQQALTQAQSMPQWGTSKAALSTSYSLPSSYGQPKVAQLQAITLDEENKTQLSYLLHVASSGKSVDPRFFKNRDIRYCYELLEKIEKIKKCHTTKMTEDSVKNDDMSELRDLCSSLQQLLNQTMGEIVPTGFSEEGRTSGTLTLKSRDSEDIFFQEIRHQVWTYNEKKLQQYTRPAIFYEEDNPLHEFIYACVREITVVQGYDKAVRIENAVLNKLYALGYFYGAVDVIDMAFPTTIVQAHEILHNKPQYVQRFMFRFCNEMLMLLHSLFSAYDDISEIEENSLNDYSILVSDYIRKQYPEDLLKIQTVDTVSKAEDIKLCQKSMFFNGFALQFGPELLLAMLEHEPHFQALVRTSAPMIKENGKVMLSEAYSSPVFFNFAIQEDLKEMLEAQIGTETKEEREQRRQGMMRFLEEYADLYIVQEGSELYESDTTYYGEREWNSVYAAMHYIIEKQQEFSSKNKHAPLLAWNIKAIENFIWVHAGTRDLGEALRFLQSCGMFAFINTQYFAQEQLKNKDSFVGPERIPALIVPFFRELYRYRYQDGENISLEAKKEHAEPKESPLPVVQAKIEQRIASVQRLVKGKAKARAKTYRKNLAN